MSQILVFLCKKMLESRKEMVLWKIVKTLEDNEIKVIKNINRIMDYFYLNHKN